MRTWQSNDDYAEDLPLASAHLGRSLFAGEVALFLGSGVTKPLGLPTWADLVRTCLQETGLPSDGIFDYTPTTDLMRLAGDVRRKIKNDHAYHALVRRCLYNKAHPRSTAIMPPLLTALGALMMGSRRGRVRDVLTLNFDDTIEWYLRVNGFLAQVISELPCLARDVDVTVYHPHGFLPLDEKHGVQGPEIVFDDESYAVRTFGKNTHPMLDATRFLIESKVILALGLGWSADIPQGLIKATAASIKNRPLAFWCFGPPRTPEDAGKQEIARKECLVANVVPLQFETHDDYAPFVLSISEQAMHVVDAMV